MRKLEQILADLAVFTDAQRSLAWSPMPPEEFTGPHDGRTASGPRLGETPRMCWIVARFRWEREQKAALRAFSPTHCSTHTPEHHYEAVSA